MNRPLINVTIPVLNEERVLAANVGRVVDFLKTNCRYSHEIVIANNGSTDRTLSIAEELSQRYPVVCVVSMLEPGRGRALKKVWSESTADILSYMDVDLSTDLNAFPKLIEPLVDGTYDLATGSRRIKGSITTRRFKREFLSAGYHNLVKLMFRTRFNDVQCGFKAITRAAAGKLLPQVENPGWLMDLELLILAERLGYRVKELPVHWTEGTDSRVKVWSSAFSSMAGMIRLYRRTSK